MDRTKYRTEFGDKSAPDLIKALQKSKSVKYSRSIDYYYASLSAVYSDVRGPALLSKRKERQLTPPYLPPTLSLMPSKPSGFTSKDGLLRWFTKS